MTTEVTESHQPATPVGVSSSKGLGPLPEPDVKVWQDQCYFYGQEPRKAYSVEAVSKMLAAERERCAKLPRLPTPRVLASGTIAGKAVELRGWHTDDIEIWERQHGLKFGA